MKGQKIILHDWVGHVKDHKVMLNGGLGYGAQQILWLGWFGHNYEGSESHITWLGCV